jgi:hypothetical protein
MISIDVPQQKVFSVQSTEILIIETKWYTAEQIRNRLSL